MRAQYKMRQFLKSKRTYVNVFVGLNSPEKSPFIRVVSLFARSSDSATTTTASGTADRSARTTAFRLKHVKIRMDFRDDRFSTDICLLELSCRFVCFMHAHVFECLSDYILSARLSEFMIYAVALFL